MKLRRNARYIMMKLKIINRNFNQTYFLNSQENTQCNIICMIVYMHKYLPMFCTIYIYICMFFYAFIFIINNM